MNHIIPSNSDFQYHSDLACSFLNNNFKKKDIKWINEEITTDDYTLTIYTLFIVSYNKSINLYVCNVYMAEESVYSNEVTEYYLFEQHCSPIFKPVYSWKDVHHYKLEY